MTHIRIPLLLLGCLCMMPPAALAGGKAESGWTVEGHYSTRMNAYSSFFAEGAFDEDAGSAQLWTHQLQIRPSYVFDEKTKLSLEVRGLRDVVWGDNQGLASTSLFAGSPSTTDLSGHAVPTLSLQRAWIEFPVPAGLVKVGRMPSHWGLGLLSNHGNGFDDVFGENHYGSTYDRALFATRPLAIAQKILGQEDSETPLFVAVALDRLVDDPLSQYYGYCTDGLTQSDAGFRARCDADGDGVTEEHDAVEDRDVSLRSGDWWADGNDDVTELVYVLIYKGDEVEFLGEVGELTAGAYVVQRSQTETDSDVLIADVYGHAKFFGATLDFEVVKISGKTRALPIPNTAATEDPYNREADMLGYVVRGGYETGALQIWFEHGFASGDDYLFDDRFSGRALHADFNVGLLLYEEVLARASYANALSTSLGSKGGVYNSRYVFPSVHYQVSDGLEVVGAFLLAWPDQVDGDVYRCHADDTGEVCGEVIARESGSEQPDLATQSSLGWEVDLALRAHWSEHMYFSLESGFAKVGDRIRLQDLGLNSDGQLFTAQLRFTYQL